MSFNEMFDKIIRRKVSEGETEFPFDAANWSKASRMIDAERGTSGMNKNSKYFLLLGSLFLIIAGITIFSLVDFNDDKTNLSENKTVVNANDKGNANNAIITEKLNTETTAPKTEVNSEVNAKTIAENNSENKANEVKANTPSEKVSNVAGNNVNEVKANTKENNVTSGKNSRKVRTQKQTNVVASVDPNGSSAITKKSNGKKQKNTDVAKNEADNQKNKEQETDPNIVLGSAANMNNAEAGDNYLTRQTSILQIWQKDAVLKTSVYDFIRGTDRYDDYYKGRNRTSHFLNAEAGASYLFGWETANGKDAKGFNAFGGINYGIRIARKTQISIGAQFYNVGNIKQSFYTKTNLDYDFGVSGSYTNITQNSLYYFSVPVRVSYPIAKKSRIGLGINTGFLFNGKGTVESYSIRDNVKSNDVITKTTGHYDGVNKTNIMLSAFYNQAITKRMSVNGEFIYGLSDVYKNTTKSGTIEKNMGLRLSLQYTLFTK